MKKTLLILPILFFFHSLAAETIVFKECSSENYNYEKNDYVLDLEKELMTREFVYSKDSYEKLRLNDITVKKEKNFEYLHVLLNFIEAYYNEKLLNNNKNLIINFLNYKKILIQINNTKKFNLDEKNISLFIKDILLNE